MGPEGPEGPEGPQGPTGDTGATGATGAQGGFGGDSVNLGFSTTTTDSDPGDGMSRFNNATFASVTQLFLDDQDLGGNDIQAWIATLDDSTNTVKGALRVFRKTNSAVFAHFLVNSITEATGYWKVAVAPVVSAGSFINLDNLVYSFARAGDEGDASDIAAEILAAPVKPTIHGDDLVAGIDSESAGGDDLTAWEWNTIFSHLNGLYVSLTASQTVAGTKTFSSQLLGSAGFSFAVDGTNGLITRNTTAVGGSLRNMLDLRVISSGSVADGFGPSLFFSMNDAETGGDNFLGSIGYGRDGADTNGKLVIRNYVGGVSTIAGEINSALNWGIGPLTSTLARLHIFQNTLGALVRRIQTAAANDDVIEDLYQNKITTTNATPTTLHTFAIPANNTVMIEARVIARRTGGSAGAADDGASYTLIRSYTTKAGVVTLLGIHSNFAGEDQAAWDCALVISGTNVIVQVTGATNNNISWAMTKGEISMMGS
jgi:hypothetical protein